MIMIRVVCGPYTFYKKNISIFYVKRGIYIGLIYIFRGVADKTSKILF